MRLDTRSSPPAPSNATENVDPGATSARSVGGRTGASGVMLEGASIGAALGLGGGTAAVDAAGGMGGVLLYTRGIHRTLALLTLFYFLGAIGPWIVVFQTR